MDTEDPLDMSDYKNPASKFQKEVSRIKFNVHQALSAYADAHCCPP